MKLLPAGLLLAVTAMGIASCNKKEDEPTDETVTIVTLPNVAVTSFKLKADKNVMTNLDSVFFSIDLQHGVIYNADSLPKGTKIDKLIPNIKYSSAITTASIVMEGGNTREGTVDYIKHPNDSIDFTGNVQLIVATKDDEMTKTYTLKVNVHKEEPDSLVWDEVAVAQLPSRMASPRNQKTVDYNGKVMSLIEENDGSFTLSSSDNLFNNTWEKNEVSLPFRPDIRSLAASTEAIYILDDSGMLFSSLDGMSWTSTGETWNRIIGGYTNTVVGIKTGSQGLEYSQYPLSSLNQKNIDPEFPIDGFSNFVTHSNKWTSSPVAFFCGGVKSDGTFSDCAWAFDGAEWISLAQSNFPALKGSSLIPYFTFRNTTNTIYPSQMEVWMLLGGEMEGGEFNRTVYISYDNGVNWKKGDAFIQLPNVIPAMTLCDNMVLYTSKETNISNAWNVVTKSYRTKSDWSVDGDILSWECPYIYLIGGFDTNSVLCNTIWRGALNRLSSAPLI